MRPALLLCLLTLSVMACSSKKAPRGNPPPGARGSPRAPKVASKQPSPPAPTVATPKPAKAPAPGKGGPAVAASPPFGYTPASLGRLGRLVSALRAQKSTVFKVRELLLKHMPDLEQTVPKLASVELLQIKKGGVLVAALVRLLPRGYKRCAEDNKATPTSAALFISRDGGKESLALSVEVVSDDLPLSGKSLKVELPDTPLDIPVFYVQYPYSGETCEEGGADFTQGTMVQVYIIAPLGVEQLGDTYPDSTSTSVPGNDRTSSMDLDWLAGKQAGTMYLAAILQDSEETTPCTGDPDDNSPDCQQTYTCKQTTTVFAVTRKESREIDRDKLAALKLREPALARLTPDYTGDTRRACRRILGDPATPVKKPGAALLDLSTPDASLPELARAMIKGGVTAAVVAKKLNSRGMRLYKKKQYSRAAVAFELSHKNDPSRVYPIYNRACMAGLLKDAPGAVAWLKKLEKLGTGNAKTFLRKAQKDRDFDPVRDTPQFKALGLK